MFSFFKKKSNEPKINDVVFATRQAKWKALGEVVKHDPNIVLVAWFEESLENLEQYLQSKGITAETMMYRALHKDDRKYIFIEHYPLAEKERNVFASLNNAPTVYSSLDDAFFRFFGGDRISSLLSRLGLEENEAISHSMITRSIYGAQEKLAEKVTLEQSARSMEEWMQKNIGSIHT